MVEDGRSAVAATLLMVGFASVAILDPLAARRREAPLHFARLRPVQMIVPVLCLASILVLPLR